MKKKIKKISYSIVIFVVILYVLILIFPQFLFANKFEYKNFTVYYHNEENEKDLKAVLDKSIELLAKTELFNQKVKQKIYLCNEHSEFNFFAPMAKTALAVNYPIINNIFITKSSFFDDRILKINEEKNLKARTLSGIIAHETTHSLLENELGIIKNKFLPTWKMEGFCDFIANESSYDEKIGLNNICNDINVEYSPTFQYFKYRLYATYLLKDKNISLNSFLNDDFDVKILEAEIKNKYCGKIN
jgi:hypothetical protein